MKGIKDKYINETIEGIKENNDDQDFFSAIKICKKKRIGPSRNENNRPLFFKKDLGILARSGFNFETSRKVLDMSKMSILKLLISLVFYFYFFQLNNIQFFFI